MNTNADPSVDVTSDYILGTVTYGTLTVNPQGQQTPPTEPNPPAVLGASRAPAEAEAPTAPAAGEVLNTTGWQEVVVEKVIKMNRGIKRYKDTFSIQVSN